MGKYRSLILVLAGATFLASLVLISAGLSGRAYWTGAGAQAAPALVYILHPGAPAATQNFYNLTAACNWSGVGGQVFGAGKQPVNQLVAEVTGALEGKPVVQLALTGSDTTLGPGGYVITLTNHLVASSGSLSLVIKDLQGNPLSPAVKFNTYADCQKNMVVLNLVNVNNLRRLFFPVTRR